MPDTLYLQRIFATLSERIAQRELLNPRQSERRGIRSQRVAGGHVIQGRTRARRDRRVESHRVCDVKDFPRKLDALPLGNVPGLCEPRVDIEESVAAIVVSLPGFPWIWQAQRRSA